MSLGIMLQNHCKYEEDDVLYMSLRLIYLQPEINICCLLRLTVYRLKVI